MRAALLISLALLAGCSQNKNAGNASATTNMVAAPDVAVVEDMTFRAGDGLTVFARRYDAQKPKAMILLFHQAGSSKDEYATIAPQLAAAGYSSLAVDARSGGTLFGVNETAAALTSKPEYLDAQQDLQAALNWAESQKLPVILWGSSYSSSLVFPLAVANPGKIKAILAFSPGEYFDDKQLVGHAASQVDVPAFVTSASTAAEIAAARAIAQAVPGGRGQQFIPKVGVHGSSTLIKAKNPGGVDANWRAVMAFLSKVSG